MYVYTSMGSNSVSFILPPSPVGSVLKERICPLFKSRPHLKDYMSLRKANRMSQKLFLLAKMAEDNIGVLIHLNFFTPVALRTAKAKTP